MTVSSVHHGDIVLVPFPLNSPSANQRRPAVVVSGDYYNTGTGEVVIAPITGHARAAPRIGDYALMDWEIAGLLGPSTVRARLVTLRVSHLLRRLGGISRRDMEGLAQWLRRVMEL